MTSAAPSDVRPAISVVIPHLNQAEALARCLGSLMAGTERPDEVIVVDNGSDAMPEAVCAAHDDVRLLREETPGPGPARNRGVADARGDILAFIDADCLADPDWIAAIRTRFAAGAAQILGGDVRIAQRNPDRANLLEAYEAVYAYRMDRYIAEQGFTGTGNLAMRREVFKAVGPFAGLGIAEDRDWGHRATRAGYALTFVPEMRVYHPARTDMAELRHKWDRHIAHDFAALPQGRASRVRWLAKALAMAVSPLYEMPRLLRSDRIEGPRARMLAFGGLIRIRLHRSRRMLSVLSHGDARFLAERWNRSDTN